MTRYRILPYKSGSRSAKALAEALGGKVLRLENSKYKYRPGDVIINWGHRLDTIPNATIVNMAGLDHVINGYLIDGHFEEPKVAKARNKLLFFQAMQDTYPDSIPQFWVNKQDIKDEDFPIVCRTILSGSCGDGIVIADSRDDLVDCPLYVKYVKKKDEYRVHVGRNREGIVDVISVQRKARREGSENPDWRIRNLANGFVFVRNDVDPPGCVIDAAKQALEATSLDFGAADVIYNEAKELAYVLEINTAPGLTGTTIQDYASFFRGSLSG